MKITKKGMYPGEGLVNGRRNQMISAKPIGVDITMILALAIVVFLILGIFIYAIVTGNFVQKNNVKGSTGSTVSEHEGSTILTAGAVDVHPVYASLDSSIPFAIRFTFTGNASTTYRMGAWIYGGNTSVIYSQVWTNGNFSNSSAAWNWYNQSYYTYFVTNDTGKFSHWVVLRSTGAVPISTYDYVLRVRFYEWNGTNWSYVNTVEFKNSTGQFKLVNVSQPGGGSIESGGWIWGYVNSSTKGPLNNRVIVVKDSGGNVLGTTFSEINGVDEGYDTFGSGYYRVAVKEGTNYSVEVWYDMELRGSISNVNVVSGQGTHVDITADPTSEGSTPFIIFCGIVVAGLLYRIRRNH
ncbi:MAG: hypothetical protein ACP5JR_03065 [Thermoplasmata archaeon]